MPKNAKLNKVKTITMSAHPMKHAVITLASITAILVALDMSSSSITWAAEETGDLINPTATPSSNWSNVEPVSAGDSKTAVLEVDQGTLLEGNLTYIISEAPGYSSGYDFGVSISGTNCSVTGTTSCEPTSGGMTAGTVCGTEGKGPTVYKITATPSFLDNSTINCDVAVTNLGENKNYIPYVEKLTLEHSQYLNWNSSNPAAQGPSGLVKAFSSPDGKRHYIAIGEVSDHNLPFFGPGPQNVHIFMWNDATQKFELNTTIPAVTGEIVTAVGFFTQLSNANQDFFQLAITYDAHRGGVGSSFIKTFAYDYAHTKKFVIHDASNNWNNGNPTYLLNLKHVSDLSYFENGGKLYQLVTESGSHYAGYNQKATMYEYDNNCPCFKPSNAKGSVNTYGAQSMHSYVENGTRYFLFANAHSASSYTLSAKVKTYDFNSHQFSDVGGNAIPTYYNTSFVDFPVTINGTNKNYLIVTNNLYDMTKPSPTPADLTRSSVVYESSAGNIGAIAQELKTISLPLYVKSWEHTNIGNENYFFTGFYKNPGDAYKAQQIYGWCSAEAVSTKGHWCYGKVQNFIYPYVDLTIPGDSANPHPLTYDWKSLKIGDQTYVVRIDNTKSGGNSAQVLKASMK